MTAQAQAAPAQAPAEGMSLPLLNVIPWCGVRPSPAFFMALAQAQKSAPPMVKDAQFKGDKNKTKFSKTEDWIEACRGYFLAVGLVGSQVGGVILDRAKPVLATQFALVLVGDGTGLLYTVHWPMAGGFGNDNHSAAGAYTYAWKEWLRGVLAIPQVDEGEDFEQRDGSAQGWEQRRRETGDGRVPQQQAPAQAPAQPWNPQTTQPWPQQAPQGQWPAQTSGAQWQPQQWPAPAPQGQWSPAGARSIDQLAQQQSQLPAPRTPQEWQAQWGPAPGPGNQALPPGPWQQPQSPPRQAPPQFPETCQQFQQQGVPATPPISASYEQLAAAVGARPGEDPFAQRPASHSNVLAQQQAVEPSRFQPSQPTPTQQPAHQQRPVAQEPIVNFTQQALGSAPDPTVNTQPPTRAAPNDGGPDYGHAQLLAAGWRDPFALNVAALPANDPISEQFRDDFLNELNARFGDDQEARRRPWTGTGFEPAGAKGPKPTGAHMRRYLINAAKNQQQTAPAGAR